MTVYFVAPTQQYLITSQRTVPTTDTLRTVLHALFGGPTTVEKTYGVRTAISSSVSLLRVKPSSPKSTTTTVTLDFNRAFGQISGTQQVLAVAQVVYTVTGYLGPTFGVQFEIEGVPTDVPTDTGAQVSGPVHRTEVLRPSPPPRPVGHHRPVELIRRAASPARRSSCQRTRGAPDHRCSRS